MNFSFYKTAISSTIACSLLLNVSFCGATSSRAITQTPTKSKKEITVPASSDHVSCKDMLKFSPLLVVIPALYLSWDTLFYAQHFYKYYEKSLSSFSETAPSSLDLTPLRGFLTYLKQNFTFLTKPTKTKSYSRSYNTFIAATWDNVKSFTIQTTSDTKALRTYLNFVLALSSFYAIYNMKSYTNAFYTSYHYAEFYRLQASVSDENSRAYSNLYSKASKYYSSASDEVASSKDPTERVTDLLSGKICSTYQGSSAFDDIITFTNQNPSISQYLQLKDSSPSLLLQTFKHSVDNLYLLRDLLDLSILSSTNHY